MRYRRLVALLLLVGTMTPAAVVTAAPPPPSVQAGYMYDYYYYSDNTYTTLVGHGYRNCSLQYTLHWGQITSYYASYREPCI